MWAVELAAIQTIKYERKWPPEDFLENIGDVQNKDNWKKRNNMSEKVRDLIIQATIAKNCNDTIEDADNKSEAWSKASAVLSSKSDYNEDDAKDYKSK